MVAGLALLALIVMAAAAVGAEIWRSVRWAPGADEIPSYLRRRG